MVSLTPLNILTGFLGAGKTTLLDHLLTHGLQGRKVAVILNELGETVLEELPGQVQMGENFSFTELTSGCVCCTVNTELYTALEELLITLKPETILLETTGVADPHALLLSLRGARCRVELLACLVDAANFETALQQSPIVETQVREADLLIVNKIDLVSASRLARLHSRLKMINSSAPRLTTSHGCVDLESLLGYLAEKPSRFPVKIGSAEGTVRNHGFTTLTLCPLSLSRAQLIDILTVLPPQVCRIKGNIHIEGESLQSLQYTFGRWDLRPLASTSSAPPRLVFIGLGNEWQGRLLQGPLNAAPTPNQ